MLPQVPPLLTTFQFKPEDEAISDELEKMDERFKRYNRMRMRRWAGHHLSVIILLCLPILIVKQGK